MALSLSGSGEITGFDPVASGFGKVLQVVSTTKTDTLTTTSTSFTDITGLSVSIIPSTASSKILVFGFVNVGWGGDLMAMVRFVRDTTGILIGDAAGSRTQASAFATFPTNAGILPISPICLDSPNTTVSTTYKLQLKSSGGTVYVNRNGRDNDAAGFDGRAASSITVIEVSA